MDHGEVERYSARQWLEAFAVTRARIQREAILAHGAAFIVGNIAGYLFLTEAFALSLPVTFVVLLGASILLAFFVRDSIRKPHTTQLDLILSRQIKDCRLVERMLLGEISGVEITSHTPWPFKRLIALPADQSPAWILSRVIPSLDWYVAQPRRHWRSEWNVLLIDTFLILAYTVVVLLLKFPFSMVSFIYLIVAGGMAGLTYSHLPKLRLLEAEFKQHAGKAIATDQSSLEPASTEDLDVTPTHRGLLPVINQLEQDLITSSLLFRNPYSLIPGLFGVIYYPSFTYSFEPVFFFVFLATGLIFIGGFVYWEKNEISTDYRVIIRYRLERSDLFTRLATESPAQWLDDWNVPKFFRWLVTLPLMPRGYADNLRRSVWIAAFNLDWMLNPPRRGLRPCWVLLPVQFALIIAVLVVPQTVTSGMQTAKVVHNLSGVLGFLILALSFPGAMHFGRLLVWKDELIDYLRCQAAE